MVASPTPAAASAASADYCFYCGLQCEPLGDQRLCVSAASAAANNNSSKNNSAGTGLNSGEKDLIFLL